MAKKVCGLRGSSSTGYHARCGYADCDGWTVLRIEERSRLTEIPVIMVTIVDNESDGP